MPGELPRRLDSVPATAPESEEARADEEKEKKAFAAHRTSAGQGRWRFNLRALTAAGAALQDSTDRAPRWLRRRSSALRRSPSMQPYVVRAIVRFQLCLMGR